MWQLDGLFRLLTHLLRRSERERGPLTADSMRLNQMLLNLLSNACKFTKEGVWNAPPSTARRRILSEP
jgi:signal transduction histidine kinase